MEFNEKRIPRMRTLPEAMKEIRDADPHTQLTLATLRKMVDRGMIGTVPLGNYKLINLDELIRLLADGIPEKPASSDVPVHKRRNAE
jgi:hypothetical protein